jgi:hypothetical protein
MGSIRETSGYSYPETPSERHLHGSPLHDNPLSREDMFPPKGTSSPMRHVHHRGSHVDAGRERGGASGGGDVFFPHKAPQDGVVRAQGGVAAAMFVELEALRARCMDLEELNDQVRRDYGGAHQVPEPILHLSP